MEATGAVTAAVDALRFEQVVTNLLSNAIKYGDGKPIEVRVARDATADAAHLEVIDHGPGIAPDMTEKIFEPFRRAVSSSEPIPGLGLGLYVVKTIVDGHGGKINVQASPAMEHDSSSICPVPARRLSSSPDLRSVCRGARRAALLSEDNGRV